MKLILMSDRGPVAPRLPEPATAGKWNRARYARCTIAATIPVWVALSFVATPVRAAGTWNVSPVPEVRAICHAGDSLFVGTSAGVFVLDIRNGALVDHITAGPRLPSASVRSIAARHDSVFVGTDAGLALLVGGAASVWTPRSPGKLGAVPLARIRDVSFAANGDWLLCTGGGGVGVVTRAGGYSITRRDSLLADNVCGVMDRPGGARWFATSAGLCSRVNDTTLVSFQAGAGIPRGEVRQMVGNDRVVYLLIAGRGVFRFDGKNANALEPRDVPLRDALGISYGADGSLWAIGPSWVAVSRDGAWKRVSIPAIDARETWRVVVADGAGAFVGSSRGVVRAIGRGGEFRVQLSGSLPSTRVESICTDGTGAAWFVCAGYAAHADARTQQLRVDASDLAAESIAIENSGAVFLAGRWTVRRLEGGVWTDIRPDVPEHDPAFTLVRAGERDGMWVGTRAGSLYRYDGMIWLRVARADDGIDAGSVLDAFLVHGDVWARLDGNSAVMHSGHWRRPDGVDSTTVIVDVACSPAGDWIAVSPKALFRMDPDLLRWDRVTFREAVGGKKAKDDAVSGSLTAAAFDATGRLFLGTTGGLGWVDRDGMHWLGPEAGIAGTEVTDLATDDHYLWIGFAQEGLSVVPLEAAR